MCILFFADWKPRSTRRTMADAVILLCWKGKKRPEQTDDTTHKQTSDDSKDDEEPNARANSNQGLVIENTLKWIQGTTVDTSALTLIQK